MNDALFAMLMASCLQANDLSGHGVTVSTCGSNPPSLCSNQSAPAIYIDDATGIQVSEDWWPGMPHESS